MLIDSDPEDIVYTSLFSGIAGNFLRDSVRRTGLDPDNLPTADKSKMSFASQGTLELKAWRDIWSAGQSVSGIREIVPVSTLIERMTNEYETARARLAPKTA
jgi:nitronate monooxygenase